MDSSNATPRRLRTAVADRLKHFLETESDDLLGYVRREGDNTVLIVVNLDPFEWREGVAIVPAATGLPPAYPVQDLLTGETYFWHIGRNFVRLGPGQSHIFRVGEARF